MQSIDLGDLCLSPECSSLQQALFQEIRKKIINRLWQKGARLPSTRKAAEELGISRNTVTLTYEQLVAEGYIESRAGSGFYVSVEVPEHFLLQATQTTENQNNQHISDSQGLNRFFAPGVPDLSAFPFTKWQRILQHHSSRAAIAGLNDLQGLPELRGALAHYLASSRSVDCSAKRIIITSGAQQALTIAALAVSSPAADSESRPIAMEEPGYTQMRKVLALFNINTTNLSVEPETGWNLNQLLSSQARAVYLTPSNQYPMGFSLNTDQRMQVLNWAAINNSWIIEDDYDSEFQFAHRPYASMQGLAAQSGLTNRCIYIGSFSKTMFNGLRIGYMVVPDELVRPCLNIKDALSGTTPAHTQAATAEFISQGHYLTHLRKMRKHYQLKRETMISLLNQHFAGAFEVVSQPAGLHITVRWTGGPDENRFSREAEKQGVTVRPLSYYQQSAQPRQWNSVVMGFGNCSLADMEASIEKLAGIFHSMR